MITPPPPISYKSAPNYESFCCVVSHSYIDCTMWRAAELHRRAHQTQYSYTFRSSPPGTAALPVKHWGWMVKRQANGRTQLAASMSFFLSPTVLLGGCCSWAVDWCSAYTQVCQRVFLVFLNSLKEYRQKCVPRQNRQESILYNISMIEEISFIFNDKWEAMKCLLFCGLLLILPYDCRGQASNLNQPSSLLGGSQTRQSLMGLN